MEYVWLAIYVVGAVAASTLCGICIGKAIKAADIDKPVYPQRLTLVKRAQEELAFQAKYGRSK